MGVEGFGSGSPAEETTLQEEAEEEEAGEPLADITESEFEYVCRLFLFFLFLGFRGGS